jgi:hypothetical protein
MVSIGIILYSADFKVHILSEQKKYKAGSRDVTFSPPLLCGYDWIPLHISYPGHLPN